MRTNICLAIMALFALVPFSGVNAQYSLTVESAPAVGAGGTVYRFYVNANDATDKISAVFGNDQAHLVINTPAEFLTALSTQVGALLVSMQHSFLWFQTWWTTAMQPLVWMAPPPRQALLVQLTLPLWKMQSCHQPSVVTSPPAGQAST